jgi:hypothetical protein
MGLSPLQHKLQDDDVLIHLHIPKTGGKSLDYLIEQKFPEDVSYRWKISYPTPKDVANIKFDPYHMIRGHFTAKIAEYISKNPVFITMLRHPIERVVSFYYFVRSRPASIFYDIANQIPIEEFINLKQPNLHWHINNQMVSVLSGQDDYSKIPSNEDLELSKNQLAQMPFFGLTEYFKESAQLLHYTFIWQNSFEVQHKNATGIRPTREEISPQTLQGILEYNQLDLELYTFADQLFHQRYRQMVDELKQDNLDLYRYNQDLKRDNQELYSQLHNPNLGVMFYRALFPQQLRLLFRDRRGKWLGQSKD